MHQKRYYAELTQIEIDPRGYQIEEVTKKHQRPNTVFLKQQHLQHDWKLLGWFQLVSSVIG